MWGMYRLNDTWFQGFGGETRWKEPFGIHKCRWKDNIKVVLQETGRKGEGLDRSDSGQGQVAGSSECGNETTASITCGE